MVFERLKRQIHALVTRKARVLSRMITRALECGRRTSFEACRRCRTLHQAFSTGPVVCFAHQAWNVRPRWLECRVAPCAALEFLFHSAKAQLWGREQAMGCPKVGKSTLVAGDRSSGTPASRSTLNLPFFCLGVSELFQLSGGYF
jgi:hypothetical protein